MMEAKNPPTLPVLHVLSPLTFIVPILFIDLPGWIHFHHINWGYRTEAPVQSMGPYCSNNINVGVTKHNGMVC